MYITVNVCTFKKTMPGCGGPGVTPGHVFIIRKGWGHWENSRFRFTAGLLRMIKYIWLWVKYSFSVQVIPNLQWHKHLFINGWFFRFSQVKDGSERLPSRACAPWDDLWTGWVHCWLMGAEHRNVNYYCCQRCGLEMIWKKHVCKKLYR